MSVDYDTFHSKVQEYANRLQRAYQEKLGLQANPEEQLKRPVAELIEAAADVLGIQDVQTLGEVQAEESGRPDVGILVGNLLTGHIELKKPGKGSTPRKYSGHDKRQWDRYQKLPNLIYTDGTEFSYFRSGEKVDRLIRFAGDPTEDGGDAITENNSRRILELFREFLDWEPIPPKTPKQLAKMLAPVTRLLRDDVLIAMRDETSAVASLSSDWRRVFFPDASDSEFADAYAQTLTYALLLARFTGAEDLTTGYAVRAIESNHSLLAETLRVLGDSRARGEVETALKVLERILEGINPRIFEYQPGFFGPEGADDPWLYFYEDFLAEYDPKMRKNRGVYFTPIDVVQCQIKLTAELLRERFDAYGTYADDKVITLDPACGTGTYVLAAVRYAIDEIVKEKGAGAKGFAATRAANGMHAFEILVGPYSVAHLRLTQQVLANDGSLPDDGAHVYLTNTLESPNEEPPGSLPFALRELSEEHQRAQRVKRDVPVLVCIGNPPYDRQQISDGDEGVERKGSWIRYGSDNEPALLDDFLRPLRDSGDMVHAKSLYNDYVYFWRWALWKVCETNNDNGIVSFITASSFLRGPGFKGMRKVMRQVFDELWIINLEGDNRGARKSDNVFAIQTPVCITIGLRHRDGDDRRLGANEPASASYVKVEGSESDKLKYLSEIESFDDVDWKECASGWTSPLLPSQSERFTSAVSSLNNGVESF